MLSGRQKQIIGMLRLDFLLPIDSNRDVRKFVFNCWGDLAFLRDWQGVDGQDLGGNVDNCFCFQIHLFVLLEAKLTRLANFFPLFLIFAHVAAGHVQLGRHHELVRG